MVCCCRWGINTFFYDFSYYGSKLSQQKMVKQKAEKTTFGLAEISLMLS